MNRNKESNPLRRWIILFVSAIVVGALAIVIDVTWIKKMLWVVLLLIGFVASGFVYEMYDDYFDRLGNRKKQ
jgi:energy-converting hydrogenase Eha subunit C